MTLDRYSAARRESVRAATKAAVDAAGTDRVIGVFVVVQTRDSYYTAGGNHWHGNDRLLHLGAICVEHMRAEMKLPLDGGEYEASDAARESMGVPVSANHGGMRKVAGLLARDLMHLFDDVRAAKQTVHEAAQAMHDMARAYGPPRDGA